NHTSMKKTVLLLAAVCAFGHAPAQDLGDDELPKNKKGNEILPKKGDVALGFNTIPILDLVFDAFKTGGAYAGDMVQYTSSSNNQITGKYFLGPKTAVRVRLGINTLSGKITNPVQDAAAMHQATQGTPDDIDAASLRTVDDEATFSKNNILFS